MSTRMPSESVNLMRRIGDRCENARAVAWTLGLMLERRPKDTHTRDALLDELHEYLADTATMVRKVKKDEAAAKAMGHRSPTP